MQTLAEKAYRQIDMQGYTILPRYAVDDITSYLLYIRPIAESANPPGKFHFIGLAPRIFTSILHRDVIRDIMLYFCGEYFRVDNHFCFCYPGNGVDANIHGGPFNEFRSVYYQSQGAIRQTSNLKIGIALQDQQGTGFVPGSHRTHGIARGCNTEPDEVVTPQLYTGDVVIFTDALVHGTVHTDKPRQMLYYTITPGHVAWAVYQEPAWLPDVPAATQKMFRPPGIMEIQPDRARSHRVEPTIEVE